jgi:hypothetical protein
LNSGVFLEAVKVLQTFLIAIGTETCLFTDFSLALAFKAHSGNVIVPDFAEVLFLHLLVIILSKWVIILLDNIIMCIRIEQINSLVARKGIFQGHVVIGNYLICPYLQNTDTAMKIIAT